MVKMIYERFFRWFQDSQNLYMSCSRWKVIGLLIGPFLFLILRLSLNSSSLQIRPSRSNWDEKCSVDLVRLMEGDEGRFREKGLVGSHIVVRHGHRTPMKSGNDTYGSEICRIGNETAKLLARNRHCLRYCRAVCGG